MPNEKWPLDTYRAHYFCASLLQFLGRFEVNSLCGIVNHGIVAHHVEVVLYFRRINNDRVTQSCLELKLTVTNLVTCHKSFLSSPSQVTSHFFQVQVKSQVISSHVNIKVKPSDKSFLSSPSQVTSHFFQVQVKSQVISSHVNVKVMSQVISFKSKSSDKSFLSSPSQVTSHF